MPVLRMVRQERYAQARARGLTQPKAYVEAGYEDGDPHIVKESARRLEAQPAVRARIDELLEAGHEVAVEREEKRKDLVAFDDAMGKVEILQGLRTVFELAIKTSVHVTKEGDLVDGDPVNLGAANRALELMGKQEGMFADTKIIKREGDGMNTAQLRAAIEKLDEQLVQIGEQAKDITVLDHEPETGSALSA